MNANMIGINDIIFCCACACGSAAGALGVTFIWAKEAPVIINGSILRAFPRKGMLKGSSNKVSGLERSLIQNMKGACLISKESCKVRKSAKKNRELQYHRQAATHGIDSVFFKQHHLFSSHLLFIVFILFLELVYHGL